MKRIKTIIFAIPLIALCTIVFAEGSDKEKKETVFSEGLGTAPANDFRKNYIYPEWGFYIDAAPGVAFMQNKNLPADLMNLQYDLGYSFSAGYFKTLSPFLKIKTGLGITGLKNTLQGSGEAPPMQFLDVDNDPYTEHLYLSDVKNSINSTFLSIPVLFEVGNTNINRPAMYINVGFIYSFMVNDSYQPSGSYSTTGEYRQWGVTLENIDELGFHDGKNLDANANFRKNNLSLQGGFGFTFPMSSAVILKAGFTGNYGISDLGNNSLPATESVNLPPDVYAYRQAYIDNSLALTKGTKTRQVGFEIGLLINKQLK